MKKYILNCLAMLLLIVGTTVFTACSKDDENQVRSYTMNVRLDLQEGLQLSNLSAVKLVSINDKGMRDTTDISSDGAKLTLLQGQYTFIVTGKVKDEANAYISGKATANLFSENVSVTIPVNKVVQSSLIFKAIFNACGTKRYLKDTYFEIVNNSDEVQYLDGVILMSPAGNQISKNAWQAHGLENLYASGQGSVLAFPGSGKEHPLQPGESVVIANDAADHSKLASANSPNLSSAQWEIYLPESKETDYPAPNLDVIFINNTKMKTFGSGVFGRAYVLARCPEGTTPQQFAKDPKNLMTTPGTQSNTQFLMMPSKYVLDAVDIWAKKKTTHYPAFMPKDDAEGIVGPDAYSGKCVRRKVVRIENGRAYYQDTNNSAADFISGEPLTPGQKPNKVD